mgnify:CR=1 FL=1
MTISPAILHSISRCKRSTLLPGFTFLSVNPIDPARCQNITNEEISDFNAQLQELAGDMYIDSYTWMRTNDIQTKDGIHYEEDDYRALYKYVKTQIELHYLNDRCECPLKHIFFT